MILEYLQAGHSLTAIECSDILRITSLSQEITRLEKSGIVIDHIPERSQDKHWTRYKLAKVGQLNLV